MNLFFLKFKPSAKETQLTTIIDKLLDHPQTKLLMDPLREHFYLDNKGLNYFVLITNNIVKITNHKFYYTNEISGRFALELQSVVKSAISRDRQRIEDEMFKNETELLLNITKKLTIKTLSPIN